ncbi:sulfotransferase [Micromonospora tarensis]|uniref:Sulfotransferase n=1 Tax=Micromonospora tarensis TaxID=2806100 RepID=A0ABS1YB82_9ACTN|nr:sulfotransferase [Micromonospora tarensis]MBM0274501.1 sulfotransferase [Micromonospora tarensis]
MSDVNVIVSALAALHVSVRGRRSANWRRGRCSDSRGRQGLHVVTVTDRLVTSPVFVLSSIRSGSTLLRCILNTHSQLHAPHELQLVDLAVGIESRFARLAMEVAVLGTRELEHLLWDRVLHRELLRSGKPIVIDKTPTNLLRWRCHVRRLRLAARGTSRRTR